MGVSRLQLFLYSINFQIRQIQATNQRCFSGNDNPFSIKPTVVRIKTSEKWTSVFLVLNLFTFFEKDKTMVPKNQHLMLSGYFQINVPDIDFTDEAVIPCDVTCDVPVVKILS